MTFVYIMLRAVCGSGTELKNHAFSVLNSPVAQVRARMGMQCLQRCSRRTQHILHTTKCAYWGNNGKHSA